MNTQLVSSRPEQIEADAVAVFLNEASREVPPSARRLDPLTDGLVSEIYGRGEFRGKLFDTALLHRPAGFQAARLLLVGGGPRDGFTASRLRQAAGAAVRFAKQKSVRRLALASPQEVKAGDAIQALVEGALLGGYEPDAYRTEKKNRKAIENLIVMGQTRFKNRFETGVAIAEAQNFTRTLVNEPGNRLTPKRLADQAREMASETGLGIEVMDREQIEEREMRTLLGVAQGSAEPPVLIVVKYRPSGVSNTGNHLGLIGKAVTFDTGGISLKPAADMDRMKYDMAGGAAVLGAMKALATLKPRIPVTAVIPSVENMPGSKAQRPGDVVTSMSGKTVEILNTDAEGRLILADALTYAKQTGCTHLVDAATLTGAIVVALGHERVGAFTNSDPWLDEVLRAAESVGDKFWPMPLDEEYRELIRSPIADLANVGPRWAGAVTAAMFLKEFADPIPWAHLDIAGAAWIENEKPDLAKGPSGVPLRALTELAMKSWRRAAVP